MDRLTAHLDRGWELVSRGDLSGAMASAEQTLELASDSPDVHNLIGYIHAAKGDLELALEHYRHAIDLDDSYLEAMLNAAELLIHPLGDVPQAIHLLDQALSACNNSDELADASILKFDALLQQGDAAAAEQLLDSLPSGPFENEQIEFQLGRAHFELGRHERARALLEAAVTRATAPPDAHYYLGLAHEKAGNREAAIVSLLRTRHLDGALSPPPWSPAPGTFEKFVQSSVRALPKQLRDRLEGTLIMVAELPGLEVVAEGVDPRTPLLIDGLKGPQGEARPTRLFVYQQNVERLVRQPLELQQDVQEILEKELSAHLLTPAAQSTAN